MSRPPTSTSIPSHRRPLPPTNHFTLLDRKMNRAQAQLRLRRDHQQYVLHNRRRSFDNQTFKPLATTHLWLAAADKSEACQLSPWTDNESLKALKDDKLKDDSTITWFVYHKDDPETQIGAIWLFQFSSRDDRCASASVGYTLSEKARGKGYMQESVGAVLKFAFETVKLDIVEARIRSTNERSKAVARKSGFKNIGQIKKGKWGMGESGPGIEIVEMEVWALRKGEWEDSIKGAGAEGDAHL
jgi:RimJ/RimL family protein N-acetyltransferase